MTAEGLALLLDCICPVVYNMVLNGILYFNDIVRDAFTLEIQDLKGQSAVATSI
jgi:hypothetical protein